MTAHDDENCNDKDCECKEMHAFEKKLASLLHRSDLSGRTAARMLLLYAYIGLKLEIEDGAKLEVVKIVREICELVDAKDAESDDEPDLDENALEGWLALRSADAPNQ